MPSKNRFLYSCSNSNSTFEAPNAIRILLQFWIVPSALCFSKKGKGKMIKCSRYRPGVAQRVGRGIALFFHDRGTRRGWVVSSTPRPHFTHGKDPVPIVQEAEWAPGPVWTRGKSRPHRDSIPDSPARSQSLYQLSYPTHQEWQSDLVNIF